MPVKACDKLLSYNSCKGNGSEERSIRCSNCGEKLIEGAKFCDICGHPCPSPEQQAYLRKKARRKWIILIVAASIVVLLIGGRFAVTEYFKHNDKQIREEYSLKDVKAVVTAEECEKIKMGMSIEEVEEIIGGKGKMSYESEYSIEYTWPGEYYDDEDIFSYTLRATFDRKENRMDVMDEDNILLGKEAREYDDMHKNQDFSELDVPTVTSRQLSRLEEGMSYSEVASILGGDGKKVSEEKTIRSMGSPEYPDYETSVSTEYAWKCVRKEGDKEWSMGLHFNDDELSYKVDRYFLNLIK